jgi:AcrR family transcriptional regulator
MTSTVYGGSGDPARSLALLWRHSSPDARRGRKGRTDLDVDRIVRAAIELADADGLASLSMRKVADKLGVGAMSLYTYVPSKAELLDLMVDAACDEAPGPVEDNQGWRAKLEQVARGNWAMYHRHPWMLQASVYRPGLGPNAIAKYERELGAVEGIGLTDLEMDSVVSLIAGYVEGAARRSVEKAQVEQQTGMTDDQWWAAYAPLLTKLVDFSRYPIASRVGAAAGEAHGSAYDPDHAFEFGLQRVLDGIEVLVGSRH